MYEQKVYLGEAAYASFDGYGITVTTEEGGSSATNLTENKIYFDSQTLEALINYYGSIKTHIEQLKRTKG